MKTTTEREARQALARDRESSLGRVEGTALNSLCGCVGEDVKGHLLVMRKSIVSVAVLLLTGCVGSAQDKEYEERKN